MNWRLGGVCDIFLLVLNNFGTGHLSTTSTEIHMRNLRIILIGLTLAACAELPTDSKAGPPEAGGPSYNGGLVFGSGNRSDSTATTASTDGSATTSATSDGGVVFGSGN